MLQPTDGYVTDRVVDTPTIVASVPFPFGIVRITSYYSAQRSPATQPDRQARRVRRIPGYFREIIEADDQRGGGVRGHGVTLDEVFPTRRKAEGIQMAHRVEKDGDGQIGTPVVDLSHAPGERASWEKPAVQVYLWAIVELLVIYNPWQISSRLRVGALRRFGAEVGKGVIIRPRTRIKFPWKLSLGDRCWIGEGAWIHNQDRVEVGNDVVISQEVFITTGSHALAADMALITRPVRISDGAWLTTRSMVLGGVTVGRSAVISPNTVIPPNMNVPENSVVGSPKPEVLKKRFNL